ncbi:MAG: hypothetical protein H8D34_09715 [Chloroflexi bacterium]|nr:hypothetical protein [Chloroflexota bacterium]
MTDHWLLNWTIMAVSLFNTIVLLWLGFTVVLNAQRRDWGLWLVAAELIMGGIFFLSHSIILDHGFAVFSQSLNFWWHVGWVPVVTIPYAWYIVMLWFGGFWDGSTTRLYRRHWIWFVATSTLALVVIVLMIFANPLPSFDQIAQFELTTTLSMGGIPLLVWVYPFYIFLCLVLSLDVLRHPAPSLRIMGDQARRRARPWLMAATLTQIIVSLFVGAAMFWVTRSARLPTDYRGLSMSIAWFDLTISALIAISVFLMGQAVTFYEIFTGESMPRRGMARYWRRAVILGAGFAIIMGAGLVFRASPIYIVLLSGLLIIAFFALVSWRSFQERERYVKSLRPFVSGQGVLERFVMQPSDEIDLLSLFQALSEDVLGLQRAVLLPLGSIAGLIDEPFIYPSGDEPGNLPSLEGILESPEQIGVPLHRATNGVWVWAVPLWGERGLIGVLYLGPKIDGGLYSQEEIDIARTTGERLLDTYASAVMAQRLMALQRQQMAEGQVLDRNTRRVLHDEVLPQLHAAMLELSSGVVDRSTAIKELSEIHQQIAELLRQSPIIATPDVEKMGVLAALHRAVDEELSRAFDEVLWQVSTDIEEKSRLFPIVSAEVIYYAAREAIRNAAQHGRVSNRPLSLRIATRSETNAQIIIEDNGAGLGHIRKRGDHPSGYGLALHSTMMALIGGSLTTETEPGEYTRVVLTLPSG